MTHVAILRCGKLPSFVTWEIPNLEELFEEDNLLVQGFRAQGVDAVPVVWNDPDVDWDLFDAALIRSTWDYLDERENFLQVLSRIKASACRLFNPLEAVRWNIDKRYLFDLVKWGVPIIPTFLASSAVPANFDQATDFVVLKPTVGLGGSHSQRVPVDALTDTLTRLKASQPDLDYLVQPFIEDIITEGEWSFIFFDRQLSHVLLKKPAPGEYRVQGIYGGSVEPAQPTQTDLKLAETVMARIPFETLYARLDFVRVGGQLAIIEVELIEPIFSFHLVPESIARLVYATKSSALRRI